jgi:xanthine dehydrogenase YagS FAD-binding subunit
VDEAIELLQKYAGRAVIQGGGTDLLPTLKAGYLSDYPKAVINIKTIPHLDALETDGPVIRLGAAVKLAQLIESPFLQERYPVLTEAVRTVATPQIRNMATVGGNLCQDIRCWYYRYPAQLGGPVQCARKGQGPCLAVKGDNRYHAVMGAKRCFAVCPSDLAVALTALEARLVICGPRGQRTVLVEDFFGDFSTDLIKEEMVLAVEIPGNIQPTIQRFIKFTTRAPIDFAIVSAAAALTVKNSLCHEARIALGAVAPGPVRTRKAEDVLKGKALVETAAAEAAEEALKGARPLSRNGYKIPLAKTLIQRAILGS